MSSALFITTVDITLEAFLLPFAEHLRSRGWRVDALANGATTNDRLAPSFDNRYDIDWTRNPLSLGSLASAKRVRHVVADGGYDIVWVHTPVAATMARFALRKRPQGQPVVVYTAHGFHFHASGSPLSNAVYRSIERWAARRTDHLVTINDEDFQAAKALGTIASSSVHLIRGIGVDTRAFAPGAVCADDSAAVRAKLQVPESSVLISMIAEFGANKRHSLALHALALVRDPTVVLAFVGTGPLEDKVRAEAASLGLSERVRFAGYRHDVPTVLAASDAVLLCSAREGLNRSGLEAMAAGVPVIGTPTRGIADLIGADEAGWVATSHSAEALAEVIDEAAAHPGERARRGAAGRRRAETDFSLSQILAEYDALFARALASRGDGR
ncbi:MAG: glycosyltransferase [Coriobacteriia bacterium]|nr:glycosyltransferase [Coriobacteriia bacterium]